MKPPRYPSFLDYLKFEKRYSVHTIISYQTDLISFFDFLGTDMDMREPGLKELTHSFIRSWLAGLKEHGLARSLLTGKYPLSDPSLNII
ncbi:MAG: site-specific integrase [Bacteroidota bacterium]